MLSAPPKCAIVPATFKCDRTPGRSASNPSLRISVGPSRRHGGRNNSQFGLAFEAFLLALACGHDAFMDFGRHFTRPFAGDLTEFDVRHFNVKINTVEPPPASKGVGPRALWFDWRRRLLSII